MDDDDVSGCVDKRLFGSWMEQGAGRRVLDPKMLYAFKGFANCIERVHPSYQ